MGSPGLSSGGFGVATVLTAVWAVTLSAFGELFDPFSNVLTTVFADFVFPLFTLAIPAGIVVGLIGGEQPYVESGLAATVGYVLSVLGTLVYGSVVHGDPAFLGQSPDILIGLAFAVLVGLVIFPVQVFVGGRSARIVRRYGQ